MAGTPRPKTKTDLTLAQLKEKLLLDEATGTFTYAGKPRPRIRIGNQCGTLRKDGYLSTVISDNEYLLHRLVILWTTGELPIEEVDHINGCKTDNRPSNLRVVNRTQNNQNRVRAGVNSATGYLGVQSHRDKYKASIRHNKESIHLGLFNTVEEAHAAYIKKKRELHEACTL